ncbi:MAG: hypothetical protein IT285_07560 [Bdellovibrionales bacterium]|nr:hypothetical protein [Bdellovibrionales bacterium]
MNLVSFVIFAGVFASTVAEAMPPPVAVPLNLDTDALCFYNHDPALEEFGPLGMLGAARGVCQGMAGVSAAFALHATFVPNTSNSMGRREARELIQKVLDRHKGRCRLEPITIPGYANLAELCRDFESELMRASIGYNANIFLREVARRLPRFLALKAGPLRTREDREALLGVLRSAHTRLSKGELPLIMYYSHVVLARRMEYVGDGQGRILKARLEVYDSNRAASNQGWMLHAYWIDIPFSSDGLPSLSGRMYWDVTPDRPRALCE